MRLAGKAHALLTRYKGLPAPLRAGAFAAVLVIAALIYTLFGYGRIYPGVASGGVSLGGLTEAAALSRLERGLTGAFKGKGVSLRCGEAVVSISAEEVRLSADIERAYSRALAYGRTGGILRRAGEIAAAFFAGADVGLPCVFDKQLAINKADAFSTLVNREVTPWVWRVEGSELVITRGADGLYIDPGHVLAVALTRLSEGELGAAEFAGTILPCPAPSLYKMCAEADRAPREPDIEIAGGGYSIIPPLPGLVADAATIKSILDAGPGPEYRIPLEEIPPIQTAEQYEALLFRDILGEAATAFKTYNINRTENIRLAARAVDGRIIKPGESFSFNETVGERTEGLGYRPAKTFSGRMIVESVGGGVCQVSTTIYMAALRADLVIQRRIAHGFLVSYAPPGQDATVSYGALDFVFKNSSDYPVMLRCRLEGGTLHVTLYGTDTEDKTVVIESVVLSRTPHKTVYIENHALAPGVTRVTQSGIDGCESETYKYVYIAGEQKSSELLYRQSYAPCDRIVERGP